MSSQTQLQSRSALLYKRPLVPPDFVVPTGFRHRAFVARMLSVRDLIPDYDAVMSSESDLIGLMGPNSDWPRGLTLEEDLIDLGWHQREFTLRRSFAYTVMAPDESLCLGCCYINPSNRPGFEVDAFYWVRSSHKHLEEDLSARFRRFLAEEWPFSRVAFPGRDHPWPQARP
jgi:hypothetical protein